MIELRKCCLKLVVMGLLTSPTSLAGVTGKLRLHSFRSEIYGNERMLRVWLPPESSRESQNPGPYPVLYLNDGQSLFDETTSTFSNEEWMFDDTVTRLIEDGAIPPVIVVGIDHPGKAMRPHEYLPWEDIYLHPPTPNPQGKLYPRFLLEEVVPFIESRYPVQTVPSGRLIGGASYGGLIAVYTVVARAGEFGKLLVESPSLYVNNARVLEEASRVQVWPGKVYLGVGTHEGRSSCDGDENPEAFEDVRRLARIIQENSPATELKVVVEPCGLHGEQAYARRLPAALRFLFQR